METTRTNGHIRSGFPPARSVDKLLRGSSVGASLCDRVRYTEPSAFQSLSIDGSHVFSFSVTQYWTLLIPAELVSPLLRYCWISPNIKEIFQEAGTLRRPTDTLGHPADASQICKGQLFAHYTRKSRTLSLNKTWLSVSRSLLRCSAFLQPPLSSVYPSYDQQLAHVLSDTAEQPEDSQPPLQPPVVPWSARPTCPTSARQASETSRASHRNPGLKSQGIARSGRRWIQDTIYADRESKNFGRFTGLATVSHNLTSPTWTTNSLALPCRRGPHSTLFASCVPSGKSTLQKRDPARHRVHLPPRK